MKKRRVGILISGRGSNMQALIRAAEQDDYPARIVGVISNRADAEGLPFAQQAGVPTAVLPLREFSDRAAADAAMTRQLEDWGAEIICLAGFMRILSPEFANHWLGRSINIHPSLLPKFKGLDTHHRAIEAGETRHGCTVHFVVPELDAGPIIGQAEVPVLDNDDAPTLAARVLAEEHRLYPEALRKLALGEVSLTI